jgi:hypothetical protein
MEEIRAILKMYGLAVNYRHISALADVMTYRGKLMSITRHGVNRSDKGPLMRSSFEETVDILYDAAAFGLADDMNGVTQVLFLFFIFYFLLRTRRQSLGLLLLFLFISLIFLFFLGGDAGTGGAGGDGVFRFVLGRFCA